VAARQFCISKALKVGFRQAAARTEQELDGYDPAILPFWFAERSGTTFSELPIEVPVLNGGMPVKPLSCPDEDQKTEGG
jgi:hypothetical protein